MSAMLDIDAILKKLKRTKLKILKLRETLSDLEADLSEIRQQCEDAYAAATYEARILVDWDGDGDTHITGIHPRLQGWDPGHREGYKDRLSLPFISGVSSSSICQCRRPPTGNIVKPGNLLGLVPVLRSRFRVAAALAQALQGGGARVPAPKHAKKIPIPQQNPFQHPSRPPTHLSPFPEDINLSAYPPKLKCEGHNWFAVFNPSPNVKRVLYVNLMDTIGYNSGGSCVKFSQDGKWFATGCLRTVHIHETNTGTETCVLDHGNDFYIQSLCFSPDGMYLATGAGDKQIRVWSIAEQKLHCRFEGHQGKVYSLHYLPDGRFIVSGSDDGSVRIWDLHDRTFRVLTIDGHCSPHSPYRGILCVAISPDAKYIAASSANRVVGIWDITSGVLVQRLIGHTDYVYSVSFTLDGKGLMTGSRDKTIKYWDISGLGIGLAMGTALTSTSSASFSPCLMNITGHKDYVLSTAVSPDGTWLVSGSRDRNVLFWDARTGVVQCMLSGHTDSIYHKIYQVDFSPMGNLLATASWDRQVRIWRYGFMEN